MAPSGAIRAPGNAEAVKAFCAALTDRVNDPTSCLGKAYLHLPVDEIELDGNDLVLRGSHWRLADTIGFMQRKEAGRSAQLRR